MAFSLLRKKLITSQATRHAAHASTGAVATKTEAPFEDKRKPLIYLRWLSNRELAYSNQRRRFNSIVKRQCWTAHRSR